MTISALELLERDAPLATLAEAREAAARGEGRVVFVTGEPGIGKTALVTRFTRDLDDDARVLLGTCDDLSIPRPLGPIRDLVGSLSPSLEAALSHEGAAHDIHGLLLAELESPPTPTVLVLEDVHWADGATLDTIAVLGRRIGALPALLVLTFRGGEAPAGHPLRVVLGGIRADDAVFLELAPLSLGAVASLAGPNSDEVYAATRGNPFYVTEVLASCSPAEPPPSVANAVLGRAARLDDDARRLVELVSVVPGRVRTSLLDEVMPDWTEAALEPERRQLLEVDTASVRFRHELARNAIRSRLPISVRRRLHAEILDAMLAADAEPADIVHHAEAAGADEVLAKYALLAARRAAALESNREAYFHYRRASQFLDKQPLLDQATVLEELTTAAYVVGRTEDAFRAIERAVEIHMQLDDAEGVGRCTRVLSRVHWFAGDGERAKAKAAEAMAILQPLGESVELARAYSGFSQLAMLAEDAEQALEFGERALEVAARLGDASTQAHALVNLACARVQLDDREAPGLVEAHARADSVGGREEATRALGNLGYVLMSWGQPEPATRYAQQALAYAEEHEVHTYVSYVTTALAWLRLRAGDWDEAERITRGEVERGITVVQLLARTVLTELAVRRGDRDASERLADLDTQAERAGELQRIAPVVELMAERAMTEGAPMPTERFASLASQIAERRLRGRFAVRLGGWAAVAGIDVELDGPRRGPYAAMLRRDWAGAADGFGEVGWTYDRALMLSLLDDEESLVEAVELARALGAGPLTRRVAERMRVRGFRIPQGPRETTRANPAGLTARQAEVLSLLARGLTNAEIADRLVVSPRTAEHHVAAVLTKLGAATRRDAARRAAELGLVSNT